VDSQDLEFAACKQGNDGLFLADKPGKLDRFTVKQSETGGLGNYRPMCA